MHRRPSLVVLGLTVAALVLAAIGILTGLGLPSPVAGPLEAWRLRPRVVVGDDRFETVTVTDRANVRQAGEFDGEPGEDLAIVEFGSARLVTPATFAERQQLELGGDVRSRWTASSRLTRVGGALAIVDSGSGIDQGRLRALDGTELWRYPAETGVPLLSLVAGDLDADGESEFYATISTDTLRLDAAGQEMWRSPLAEGRITASAPRTRRDAPWIVVAGQGHVVVFDERGRRLTDVVMKDAHPIGIVDWADARYLLAGGPALRAVQPDGRVAWEWTVPGTTVEQALPLAMEPGRRPQWRCWPPALAM
jgi:hypothetical protein